MSTQQRFFVAPEELRGTAIQFGRDQSRQIANVLRLAPGTQVIVLDNSGWEYAVSLNIVNAQETQGTVLSRALVSSEPRTKITLYVGLIRAQKFEMVLQKGTELGVAAFVPMISQRCVVQADDDIGPAKSERWQRIIVEAAEVVGRGKLPVIMPTVTFAKACDQVRGLSFLLWEEEKDMTLREALSRVSQDALSPSRRSSTASRPFSVNLFVGPEGGFAKEEADRARLAGVAPVTMGPRLLRAETASIAATSAVLFALGDLG